VNDLDPIEVLAAAFVLGSMVLLFGFMMLGALVAS
jgi:hypothetical protein